MERLTRFSQRMLGFSELFVSRTLVVDDRIFRKARLLVLFYVLSAVFLVAFAIFYVFVGYWVGFWASVYGAAVVPLLLFVFRRTGSFSTTTAVFNANAILMFSIGIWGSGGIHSMILPWLAILPATGFVFDGWLRGFLMTAVCFAEIVVLALLDYQGIHLMPRYAPEMELTLILAVELGLVAFIFLILLIYESSRVRTIKVLDALNADLTARQQEVELQREALAESNLRISEANTNLETLVEARTEKLAEAKRELDTFLYEASHALRRPMVRIMGLTSILRGETDTAVVDTMHQHIETTSKLMDRILYNLIAVSELQSRSLALQPLDLKAWLLAKIADDAQLASPATVDLETVFEDGLVVNTDPAVLDICLHGILDNAVRYCAKTGRKPHIRVRAQREGDGVLIHVSDNGLGIPASEIGRVKEMFFRATEKVPGGGLGLYVSEKAIEKLGGSLSLESVLGEGTDVYLRLPG